MATWINNGQATAYGSDGPTWINNAPQQAVQYAQPQYQQPSYADQASYWLQQYTKPQEPAPVIGSFVQPSNQYRGIYNGGAGGVTGNGQINWQDASNALVPLYQQKLTAAEDAWRNGLIQNPTEMQSLRDSLKRWQDIQAAGGQTQQMFALPQWDVNAFWAEANEASRLPGQGSQVRPMGVEAVLPYGLRGQNTGRLMNSWQATGMVDSNFGSGSAGVDAGFGSFLPNGLREASFSTSNGQPIISTGPGGVITQYAPNALGGYSAIGNLNGANATPYNNGDLRSAHDYGSYLTPLLRSGANDRFAVANINGGGSMPYGNPTVSTGDTSMNWRDITNMPTGSYVKQDGSLYNPADDWARKYDPNNPDYVPPAAITAGELSLPWQIADALPVDVVGKINGALRGFEMVDAGNPSNMIPKNALINYLKDAAYQFGTDRKTWQGDGAHFSTLQNILSQPWANRAAAPMMYPSMAALFL